MKRMVVGLCVALLCVLVAHPVAADSESWTLWSSTDCSDWSAGCDDTRIIVPDGSGTTVYIPEAAQVMCHDAVIKINRTSTDSGNMTMYVDIIERPIDDPEFYIVVPFVAQAAIEQIMLVSEQYGENYITGVIIECYDPRVLVPASYAAAPEVPATTLSSVANAAQNVLAGSSEVVTIIMGLAMALSVVVVIARMFRWM